MRRKVLIAATIILTAAYTLHLLLSTFVGQGEDKGGMTTLTGYDVYREGVLVETDLERADMTLGPDPGAVWEFTTDLGQVGEDYQDPAIILRSYSASLIVYLDGDQIYTLDSSGSYQPQSFMGGRFNIFSLPDGWHECQLRIVYRTDDVTGRYGFYSPIIGEHSTLVQKVVGANLPSLIIGLAIIASSFLILCLVVLMDSTRSRVNLLTTMAMLSVTGIWVIMQGRSKQYLIANATVAMDLSFLMMALLPLVTLSYIRTNYRTVIGGRTLSIFEHCAYIYLLGFVLCYIPFVFLHSTFSTILYMLSFILVLYFLALFISVLGIYIKSRFSGGGYLLAGLFLYLTAIVLEQILLARDVTLNIQLAVYLPYIIALFIFLMRAVGESMRDSRSLAEKRRFLSLVYTDPMTGVLNRSALEDRLERLSWRKDMVLIMMFDIDGLKECNDSYGHEVGDRMVQAFAESLKAETADLDRYIFRYGGDEFLLMVVGQDLGDGKALVERIRTTFKSLSPVDKADFSAGLVHYSPATESSIRERIRLADRKMYYEKFQDGRLSRR